MLCIRTVADRDADSSSMSFHEQGRNNFDYAYPAVSTANWLGRTWPTVRSFWEIHLCPLPCSGSSIGGSGSKVGNVLRIDVWRRTELSGSEVGVRLSTVKHVSTFGRGAMDKLVSDPLCCVLSELRIRPLRRWQYPVVLFSGALIWVEGSFCLQYHNASEDRWSFICMKLLFSSAKQKTQLIVRANCSLVLIIKLFILHSAAFVESCCS